MATQTELMGKHSPQQMQCVAKKEKMGPWHYGFFLLPAPWCDSPLFWEEFYPLISEEEKHQTLRYILDFDKINKPL